MSLYFTVQQIKEDLSNLSETTQHVRSDPPGWDRKTSGAET